MAFYVLKPWRSADDKAVVDKVNAVILKAKEKTMITQTTKLLKSKKNVILQGGAIPPIRDATLRNILTPLLVVHFVGIVRRIVNRGLKRDYVQQEGDLFRVRGRIGFLQNFRRNIIVGRVDCVFCRYSELSVNTCENRLIKRALLFAERIVDRMLDQGQRSAVMLQGRLNGYLDAFEEVDDRVEFWEVRRCKRNKLYL